MNIIIVGCGKVGRTIAEQLAESGHDVTVVDKNPDILYDLRNNYDVMAIVGNGATYSVLSEAGIDSADVFIAVTNSDELNLLCCLVAKRAGHCRTVARVRDPLYHEEVEFFKEQLGLSMVINPEHASAMQIVRLLHCPLAKDIDIFGSGNIEMVEYYIEKGSVLAGMTVAEVSSKIDADVLVCAVRRGSQVHSPRGHMVLKEDDSITIMTTHGGSDTFFERLGEKNRRIRNAIIAGGSKISYYLAEYLLGQKIGVKIIEQKMDRCEQLSELLPGAVVICGDATNKALLKEAGVDYCDAFVSLTNIDEGNIFLSMFVKNESKAKVVTKINHIAFDEIVDSLNIGSIVNPKKMTADQIIQYVRASQNAVGNNVEALYRISDSQVEALEFVVKEDPALVNIPLELMEIKEDVLLACLSRNGEMIVPNGQTTLQVGDHVVITTIEKDLKDLKDILA